jgi:peptide/nickel transport system ATP-binding protein
MAHLLEVRNLQTHFSTRSGLVRAVDGVSFHLDRGELLGLVGESGCGKSMTALSVMRLIAPPGKIVNGEILFDGKDLLKLSDSEMREMRGDDIAMIFQDPMTSLNPVFTVGEQIAEALRLHRKLSRKQARQATIEAMREVAIPDPARRADDYPHQLSGGMRQRVMIAMALACNPKLLIADEPTTALDVTIQAQILELLDDLRKQRELAVLLITHDLGVIAEVADRVAVMYTGRIVEESLVDELFARPKHPYTEGLLRSVPKLTSTEERLETIEGVVPRPTDLPPGCHFAPRCPHRMPRCTAEEIPLYQLDGNVEVRCVLYDLAAAVAADHEKFNERNTRQR